MNHAKLLDCTLRDGAYLVDKKFGHTTITGIVEGLIKANIDFIEIGFLQDDGFGEGKTVFKNAEEAKRYVPKEKRNSLFTVLADYSRYSIENLEDYNGESIDAVRECFFKNERFEAIEVCKKIKDKGYILFVQPVDILGYTDLELLEFINLVNEVEPYCLSIVDTFGSMYQEDLHRIFEIINHNLVSTCRIGFHSHNNMQLSNALSQEFIRMTFGKREVVVDGTISGMGRGAGNTPTELVAQYMVSKLGYGYDIDAILDIIDIYMDNIRSRCSWGYTTPYFVAGCYSAHVNNIAYLTEKNSIRSKDIRYVLNTIGEQARKRYDYSLLEKTYLERLKSVIDDSEMIEALRNKFDGREVLILVPGSSLKKKDTQIRDYINKNNPIVISVNFIPDSLEINYIYMSNVNRYEYWKNTEQFGKVPKILTSNVCNEQIDENTTVVSFAKLVKCGWENLDNSTIMLLRLLDSINVNKVSIAGFDGFSHGNGEEKNYVTEYMELSSSTVNTIKKNDEIKAMLEDFVCTKNNNEMQICFITESRFAEVFN